MIDVTIRDTGFANTSRGTVGLKAEGVGSSVKSDRCSTCLGCTVGLGKVNEFLSVGVHILDSISRVNLGRDSEEYFPNLRSIRS